MPLVCMQVNGTYDTRPRSYMSDIHRGVVEHRSFGVPVYVLVVQQATEKEHDSTYKLDSHLLIIQEIGALENHTKRPFTNLLSHSVVDAHNIGRRGRHLDQRSVSWTEGARRKRFRKNDEFGRFDERVAVVLYVRDGLILEFW